MKKWFWTVIGVIAVAIVASQLFTTYEEAQEKEPIRTMQATDFKLPTLSGAEQSLHEERGKVVIINFWASWCEPCRTEMSAFQKFYEEYQKDVEILAVNVTSKDKLLQVQQFVEEHNLTFPILLDETGDMSTIYGAFSLPATIIIDREGNIAREIMGPMDEALLLAQVEPLL